MTTAHSKTSTMLCCLFGCLLTATAAAQSITLHKHNITLPELFTEIHNQAGYYFYFDADAMQKARPVTINVQQASIETVLPICFKDQPLDYTLNDKIIAVREKRVAEKSVAVDVTGKIVDAAGKPIAGATVSSHGLTTETRDDGTFILAIDDANAVLRVSHIGFEVQEFSLAGRRDVLIKMILTANKLDEVQVIAYGTTTKRLSTGDVSVVSAETIAQQPVSNPLAALEGRVPGLVVTQGSGSAGSSFSVLIRGQNSIQNGSNPLYIVDGVPISSVSLGNNTINGLITGGGNPLSSLNPDQIESISVLKDADATAIYGSRGANGVILITTKIGKASKTNLDLNVNSGAGSITRWMHMLNTSQYLSMRHEAFANDGAVPGPSDYDLLSWDTTRNTDWRKTLIGGTAHQTDVHATLTGGNEQTQFVLGGNYRRETSVFRQNFADRKGSGYLNLHHLSADRKLSVQVSTSYGTENNQLPNFDVTPQVFALPPDAPPIMDALGKLNWADGTFDNPFGPLKRLYTANTNNFISNLLVDYILLKSLHLKANFGYTNQDLHETSAYPLSSLNPAYGYQSGLAFYSDQHQKSWIIEPQIEYDKSGKWGSFRILTGTTFQNSITQGQILFGNGFISDELLQDISSASSITQQGSSYAKYRYSAFFGRINYNWKDKYLFNLTGRRDGSSRFGPGRQFANFAALGAAWIFTKETNVQSALPFLSFGKWRVSYGSTGNDQIGDYQYISTWSPSYYPYGSMAGLYPVNLYEPNYGWEVNKKLEFGLDLAFWKDRISMSLSYYSNHSGNQLIYQPLPSVTGFTSIQANLPAKVENTGFECSISSSNIKTKDFSWISNFNITIPRNRLTAFPGIRESSYNYRYTVGKPLSLYKTFHYTGLDAKTGVYTFDDADHDGQISAPDDFESYKSISQHFYGGFENNIQYRGFQLNIFFQFVRQTGRNYSYYYPGIPGSPFNQPDLVLTRWQKAGDKTSIQRFSQNYASAAYQAFSEFSTSDQAISDASFVRLKTLEISYQFPLTKSIRAERIKFYVQGQNLLTVTHYAGMDPENQSTNSLPPLKMLVAGVQLTL